MSNKRNVESTHCTMDRKDKRYAELLDHIVRMGITKKLEGPELDKSTSIASFQVSDKHGGTFAHVHVAIRLTTESLERTRTAAMVSGAEN